MAVAADSMAVQRPGVFRRLATWWKDRTSSQRRRILMGSLFAGALAAWDLMLLAVVGGLFALSELVPARRAVARAPS